MSEITVLVVVRTTLAAQTVASCATSLGVGGAVRTAVSEAEALARLSDAPADVVLADTAVTRPDSVGFTRRALARSPRSTLVLFGPEDPAVAASAIAAGARGVLRGADQDPVSFVAKALLLLLTAASPASAAAAPPASAAGASSPPAASAAGASSAAAGAPASAAGSAAGAAAGSATGPREANGPDRPGGGEPGDPLGMIVPAQRSDLAGLAGLAGARPGGPPGRPSVAGYPAPNRLPASIALGGAPPAGPGSTARRTTLTERELQVLRGMADGKSNAEIGRELFVSEDTVKTHARRLFRKLGARDRAHAVAAGFRSGIVV